MAKRSAPTETTEAYFLKIILYFVLGLIWIKFNGRTIFPAGFVLGFIIAQKEHFQIDRKFELLVLLVAAVLGFLGFGFFLNINGWSL
jgi:hypothetical protein